MIGAPYMAPKSGDERRESFSPRPGTLLRHQCVAVCMSLPGRHGSCNNKAHARTLRRLADSSMGGHAGTAGPMKVAVIHSNRGGENDEDTPGTWCAPYVAR